MQCQGQQFTFTEEHKTVQKTCWNELKERMPTAAPSTENKHHYHHKMQHKMPKVDACFAACKFEKLNLVEDGKLNMDAVDKYVDATFPEVAREEAKKAISDCNGKLNESLSKEEGCKSYTPLTKCVWKSLKEVCTHKAEE